LTVTARNLVHAALWLIAGFFAVGALYLLLEAEFIAIAQILVYVGAIAILILFAIMLTPDVAGEDDAPIFRSRWVALIIAAGLFGLLIIPTLLSHPWTLRQLNGADPTALGGTREIGIALMREYLLPFELASVLLLVALIGAIVIGIDTTTKRRVLTLAEELRLRQRTPIEVPSLATDDLAPNPNRDEEAPMADAEPPTVPATTTIPAAPLADATIPAEDTPVPPEPHAGDDTHRPADQPGEEGRAQ
jgi:NADH-quinone oxidoreductase subunit J